MTRSAPALMDLTPEETEAILAASGARERDPAVAPRDFRQPCRLSRVERDRLRRALGGALPRLERGLSAWLREGASLELADVREVGAVGLFDEDADPLCVLELAVDGAQGWVAARNPDAQRLAALALGESARGREDGDDEPPDEPAPRRLTPLEAGLVADFLRHVAAGVAASLELEAAFGVLFQEGRALRTALDPELAREPQRLVVHVDLAGPGLEPLTVRVYLPGVVPAANAAPRTPPKERRLPAHLARVPVELSAQLGTIELPLSDLLGLEVGDVVPLGVSRGAPATLLVEGEVAGRALFGGRGGALALQVLDFRPPEEEQP